LEQIAEHVAVITPVGDLIGHQSSDPESCVCGPRSELAPRADGSMGLTIVHYSLDGREFDRA
jgi:hypothetical protein